MTSDVMRPRLRARNSAIRYKIVTCVVKLFVAGIETSGPAPVISAAPASRTMVVSGMFEIAIVFTPRVRASRCAANVSAVSPDCVITITIGSTAAWVER